MDALWYLYVVANHTVGEIFLGIAKDRGPPGDPVGPYASVPDRWDVPQRGTTKAGQAWDRGYHHLTTLCIFSFDSQEEASARGEELERDPTALADDCAAAGLLTGHGYVVVRTGAVPT